jgi:penicillin-binding protein 1A
VLSYRPATGTTAVHGEYAAELARQLVVAQYGDEAYERGLNVFLSIDSAEQQAAYRALRRGILEHARRQPYRGPEDYVLLPADAGDLDAAVTEALADHPDNDELLAAVVLQAGPRQLVAQLQDGQTLVLGPASFGLAAAALSGRADAQKPIRRGAVIRLLRGDQGQWQLTQLPEVEGAFVSLAPQDGRIRALVGGFDFAKNPFNHVLQSWRQPGSAIKPFLYSAALEHGFSVSTVINDSPLSLPGARPDDLPWQPVNADGRFDGPMALHTALAKSKNIVSIRLLQAIGASTAQQWLARFGFDAARQPADLTLALGTGSVTPLQMAMAYAVLANGGLRVAPQLIDRLTDANGRVLNEPAPMDDADSRRAIDPRNAFVVNRMLQEVTAIGTAARAQQVLQRPDLYGKTGTTSDTQDAWFAGFQPGRLAVVWLGHDRPRSLGERETGAALALPVWIDYMAQALKNVPVAPPPPPPDGVVQVGGDWYFDESTPASSIQTLGTEPLPAVPDGDDERRRILDLFRP